MTVRWSETARTELAEMWLLADSARRRAIAVAAHAVDKRLAVDPANEGESRPDNLRVYFERPLGVLFRIEEDGSAVHVVRVWQFR